MQRAQRHQPSSRVVVGLQTVVAKAAVANQLETLGGHRVPHHFLFVTRLQHGFQKGLWPVYKLVGHEMGDVKIAKAPFVHQPPQIRSADRFLRQKRLGVERSGRLGLDKPRQVVVVLEALAKTNLFFRVGRQIVGGGRVLLNAKPKLPRGRVFPTVGLPTPLQSDKTRGQAPSNLSLEQFRVQRLLFIRQKSFVIPFEHKSGSRGKVLGLRARQRRSHRGRLGLVAVNQVATCGNAVAKDHLVRRNGRQSVG